MLSKKFDFQSRCRKEADENMKAGDFGRAMAPLQKM